MICIAIDWDDTVVDRDSQKPLPGAFESIEKLLEEHLVFIFSARDPREIVDWFEGKDFYFNVEKIPDHAEEWTKKGVVGVTNRKLPCTAYLDDRAIRFTNWKDVLKYFI